MTVTKDEKKKPEAVAANSSDDDSDFNFIQKWVFPVRMHELPKVLPVVLLLGLALLVYTANRDVKDAVVFREEAQSMMTIQYCKVLVMICAIPVATIFLKLDNLVSRDFIFFQTVLSFVIYFMVNGLCLLPYRDTLHQFGSNAVRGVRFNQSLEDANRLNPFLGAFVFPVSTVNYIVSELWGTISVSFLVWGYVNLVTPKHAAKRYYAVLGIGGQVGSMIGATIVQAQNSSSKSFAENMREMNIIMAAICVIFAGVYAFLQYYVMKKPEFAVQPAGGDKKKEGAKPKMTVGQALMYCVKEPYVMALTGMVFAYGFVMVLGEMTYKDLMKLSFDGDAKAYSKFKGLESNVTNGVAIFLMVFVGHNVIRLCGWLVTALLCPTVAGGVALLMYIMALSGDYIDTLDRKLVAKDDARGYLEMLRLIGLMFAVLSKAVKYSSFDPAKELAFLALSSEQKYKAKAAVDIIGARWGKGFGALFNIVVISLILHETVSFVTSTLVASLIGVALGMVIWVISVLYIGRNMAALTKRTEDALAAKQAPPDSIHVEGAAAQCAKTGLHIEMSTNADASFTVGRTQTPLPSRQNTPEQTAGEEEGL
jgi:AAA family ATP:ADP antiporter